MLEVLDTYLPHLIAGTSLLLSIVTSAHAVMYKRESRAAAFWVGLIWLSPFIGAALYVLLGINRIRQKAMARGERPARGVDAQSDARSLESAIDQVADTPRLAGHRVEVLENGDEAFPAMLAAIAGAKSTVHLCTYIFDSDESGLEFRDALAAAVERGVETRVLVDDVGARYSFPSIIGRLRRAGINAARFGRSKWPWHARYANLRNHRKILVVDGRIAFVGGMNIRAGNVVGTANPKHVTRDLHFRVEGPVVRQLVAVFCDDWRLATREKLACADESAPAGDVIARCLPDGPDCAVDRIRWAMLAGLACARERVRIVTPYFVPDSGLITALCTAALRGVSVEIFIPEKGNLRMVRWATRALLWQVLERHCRVFMTPPPFDHSKLMLVDDDWCLVGSANWDARSLRLNFEINMECQDAELVAKLHSIVDGRLAEAREVTLEEVDGRSIPARLRDGMARLLTPYL